VSFSYTRLTLLCCPGVMTAPHAAGNRMLRPRQARSAPMVVDSSSGDDAVSEDSEAQKQRRQAVLDQLRASAAAGRHHSEAIAFRQQQQRFAALHASRVAGEQASTSKHARLVQGIRDQGSQQLGVGSGLGFISPSEYPLQAPGFFVPGSPQHPAQGDLQAKFAAVTGLPTGQGPSSSGTEVSQFTK